jgi:hypothetical protein
LETRFNEVATLRKLRNEPAVFWSSLISRFLDQHHSTVIAIPDEELADTIAEAVRARGTM